MLRVSVELETRANLLRKEALQSLTIALAGSDTKWLWDLLTAYFGANHSGDEEDPWDFLDAAPEIPPPLPVTDTDSEDDKTSVASVATTQLAPSAPASGSQVGIGAKAKGCPKIVVQNDRLDDLCEANRAIRIYPKNKDTLSETGIPEHLLAPREQVTTGKGGSMYLCHHELCQEVPYYTQSPAGLYSHVRRKHLGMVVACPYCPKKLYWNTKGWSMHMDKFHKEVPHYGHQVASEPKVAAALLTKIKDDPDALKTKAKQQEKQLRKGLHPTKKVAAVSMKGEVTTTSAASSKPEESLDDFDKDYQPDTVDTSLDSSTSSDESSEDEQAKEQRPAEGTPAVPPERESLTFEQLQAVREGATALRRQPTLESLIKYPPTHLASCYLPPSATPAVQLASSLVMMDAPPQTDTHMGEPDDIPDLEETPPPPFPKRRHQNEDQD